MQAYTTALTAAIQGISLLSEDSWNTHHILAFRLHLGNYCYGKELINSIEEEQWHSVFSFSLFVLFLC